MSWRITAPLRAAKETLTSWQRRGFIQAIIEGELDETLQRSRDRQRRKSSSGTNKRLGGRAKSKTIVSDKH